MVHHLVQNTDRTLPSALSFLTSRGALDNAGSWASLSDGDRAAVKARYATAGIKLIVSAFGSTETPTSSGLDPVGAATTMGNWVRQYGLDGIDVDYEVRYFVHPFIDPWLTTRSGLLSDVGRYADLFVARAIEPLTLGTGTAEAWLQSFTRQLRTILPQGKW